MERSTEEQQPTLAEVTKDPARQLLSRAELARVLGVHRSTVYRWERRARLDSQIPEMPVEVRAPTVRFHYGKVVAWLNAYGDQVTQRS